MELYTSEILSEKISHISGIGKVRVTQCSKIGIETVGDLIHHFPREYEDRTRIFKLSDMPLEESCGFIAWLTGRPTEHRIRKNLSLIKVKAADGTGKVLLIWYNQAYLKKALVVGKKYIFFGKQIRVSNENQIINPAWDEYNEATKRSSVGILPIYNLSDGLTQKFFRKSIKDALDKIKGKVTEFIPAQIAKDYGLCKIEECLKDIHFPCSFSKKDKARHTLVFEEFYRTSLGLLYMKKNVKEEKGIAFAPYKPEVEKLIEKLPFTLTNAQKSVLNEINQDMESSKIMNRLVQGDVGSGKTVIALIACYKAILNGYQATIMAPTEILATQHYEGLLPLFDEFSIRAELLIGSNRKKKKKEILEELKAGNIDIIIGTHAIVQDRVEFKNLGIAVTDEQHRFGVRQRAMLSKKGINPDMLVMSATPIPRTLALILYGDLDISIMDELPPGRIPIETYSVEEKHRKRVYDFVKKNIDEGGQVYVVCPAILESETLDVKTVEELFEELRYGELSNYAVGIIHGKLSAAEKEAAMQGFAAGEIQVLLSTTVIEVGVNVPNANVMVIENAERFGLSQLHQLRGRVGRGTRKSYCILFNQTTGKIAKERMKVLCESNDGFVISEKDLQLRGPGDFFGVRQHGIPEFRIANLYEDIHILKEAQEAAELTLKNSLLTESQVQRLVELTNRLAL